MKREKKLIKIKSWKESLKKLTKARDSGKNIVSEALRKGRGFRRQPPWHPDLGEWLWLEIESAETQKLCSLRDDGHSLSFWQQQSWLCQPAEAWVSSRDSWNGEWKLPSWEKKTLTGRNELKFQPETHGEMVGTEHFISQLWQSCFFSWILWLLARLQAPARKM